MEDIKKFLSSKKLKYRETDDHIQLDCFICTDTKGRLGIHRTSGAWHCFNCEACGKKLSSLEYAYNNKSKIVSKDRIVKTEKEQSCKIKPKFHIRFFKSILKTRENSVAKYLINERKLTKESIKYFKLGHRSEFRSDGQNYDAGEHLAIPYIKDGKCVNMKYRALNPSEKKFKWRREKGGISCLYNDAIIDDLDYKEIFITESEIDCISLWVLGVKNVIGLTTGASGFSHSWRDRLLRYERIYLVLDNDIPGQEGAKKLANRLGMGRCYNVLLPEDTKDPNDFLKKYNLDNFESITAKSKQFEVPDVESLREVMDNIYRKRFLENNEEVIGYTTPWKKVNDIIGGFKEGYLVVISAKPKVGKSTMALNLMEHWGKNDINVGMYSCEMRTDRIGEKLIQMKIPDLHKVEEITPIQVRESELKLPLDYMHFYYPKPGDLELEKVCNKITEMVFRYGIKVFFFDNLHFLCRGADEKAMVDMATQAFKLLAESLNIVFFLISHPRKTNNNKQLKTDDLKGSGSIFQDADLVWLMHRPFKDGDMTPDEAKIGAAEGSMSPKTDNEITGRWTDGGRFVLAFHGDRSSFKDCGPLFNQIIKEIGKKKRKKGF